MAQQKPDPKLIDSMAMRYRHDFGLLEETHKEAIRTTMKQLWEEVVGLGFYKDEQFGNSEQLAQQTAVEWFHEKTWELKMLLEKQQISIDEYGIAYYDILDEAKEMEKQQIESAWERGDGEHDKVADKLAKQYYTETYTNE
jgi:hypothetical protein